MHAQKFIKRPDDGQARLAALRELQSAMSALLPSVLDRAFKGEL